MEVIRKTNIQLSTNILICYKAFKFKCNQINLNAYHSFVFDEYKEFEYNQIPSLINANNINMFENVFDVNGVESNFFVLDVAFGEISETYRLSKNNANFILGKITKSDWAKDGF